MLVRLAMSMRLSGRKLPSKWRWRSAFGISLMKSSEYLLGDAGCEMLAEAMPKLLYRGGHSRISYHKTDNSPKNCKKISTALAFRAFFKHHAWRTYDCLT